MPLEALGLRGRKDAANSGTLVKRPREMGRSANSEFDEGLIFRGVEQASRNRVP